MDQQIAAVKAALAAIESAIAQTDAALRAAANPQDVFALTAALVDLRSERAKLQFQLANLEAAAVQVQPLGGARAGMAGVRAAGVGGPRGLTAHRKTRMKALEKDLKSAVIDRTVVAATLTFAGKVIGAAKTVRMIGDDEEPAVIARPAGKRTKGLAGATARRRTTRKVAR